MNMRRILAVVAARNREFYRDKAGLGWNLVMPFVIVLAFAFIFSNPDEDLYKVGVLGMPSTGQETAFLGLRHIGFLPQDSEAVAVDKVRYHRIDLLLDLRGEPRYWVNDLSPKGYIVERLLLQSYADTADGPTRETVSGRAVRYVDWVLPGVLAMNVMFSSLWGVGWVIVRYRKNGVLRRLRDTPLKAGEFLLAQIISRLLVVTGVTVLVFVATDILLDFPMRGSYLALGLTFLAGAIALLSIGLTVSAQIRSEELADGLLNLISWPMMILSGVWFSLEGTNIWAQRIAEFLPLTHMVHAARRVMLDGVGLADVAPEISILLAIGVVLLGVATKSFRWQ